MTICNNALNLVNAVSGFRITITGRFSQPSGQDFLSWKAPKAIDVSSLSLFSAIGVVQFASKSTTSCPAIEKTPDPEHRNYIEECETLTAMGLRRRYPREERCHRNMLNRQAKKGAIIHPDLHEFRSFLRIIGPMPAHGATVDRIDNIDPEYAPEKIRWADKSTQNSNKGDSLIFHDPESNRTYSTSQVAGRLGVSADTIRKRRRRGWTNDEIINGKRATVAARHGKSSPVEIRQRKASVRTPRHGSIWAERESAIIAEEYRQLREEDGTEAFIPTYEFIREFRAEWGLPYSEELYEGHVRRLWPLHRPHLNYFNPALPKCQKDLIAKIDPAYVRRVTMERDLKESLRGAL
ncbi:hypothetical protein HFN87_26145 [Rhizobium laguerreae]|uniref:hypothetical protein n=1 Tax=Rhizobium laguerreae TaxID=1076926 RepID=UPI001C909E79|nr:hypothetical protein [Rhizobium laguerreae]MBY3416752.1 hypothetical protein [Rhizobium laguerreae]